MRIPLSSYRGTTGSFTITIFLKESRTALNDFIARKGTEKYYIQSALSMDEPEKQDAELKSLRAVRDSFKKIVISKSYGKSWVDDEGILRINVIDFLLDANSLNR